MATTKHETIGSRIKGRRMELGMTQTQLAKAAGITSASMSDIETSNTKMPAGGTLVKLAEVLKLNPDWILTGKGENILEQIKPDEMRVIESFRKLNNANKRALAAMIQALLSQQEEIGNQVD